MRESQLSKLPFVNFAGTKPALLTLPWVVKRVAEVQHAVPA